MGVQESKIVSDTLSEACSEAQDMGKERLEVEVNGPFLNSLKHLWSELPESTQKDIRNLSTKERRRKIPKRTPRTIIDHLSQEKVAIWKQAPLSFFKEDQCELVLTEKACVEITTYMTELRNRKGLDEVRFRLLQAIYYRFKERLGVKKMRRRDVERLTKIFFESGLRDSNASERISDWVDQGNRINELCLAVGCTQQTGYRHLANLFFFDNVAHRTIKRLSIHGKGEGTDWEILIQGIRQSRDRLNQKDREELETLTDILVGAIWEKVESVISRSNLGWDIRHAQSFQVYGTSFSPDRPLRPSNDATLVTTEHTTAASKTPNEPQNNPLGESLSTLAGTSSVSPDTAPVLLHVPPPTRPDPSSTSLDIQYLDLDRWAFNAPSLNAPPLLVEHDPQPTSDVQYLNLDDWAFNTPSNVPPTSFNAVSDRPPASFNAASLAEANPLPTLDVQYLDLDMWVFNTPSNAPLASFDALSKTPPNSVNAPRPTSLSNNQPSICCYRQPLVLSDIQRHSMNAYNASDSQGVPTYTSNGGDIESEGNMNN